MPKRRGNHEGQLYRDGRYWAAVLPTHPNQPVVKRRFTLKRDAQSWLNKHLADQAAGLTLTTAATHRLTLDTYLTTWLETWIKPPTRSANTYDSYERACRLYLIPALGHIRLSDLSADHVQAMLTQLHSVELAPASVDTVWRCLRSSLNRAVLTGRLPRNPVQGLNLTTPTNEPPPPMDEATAQSIIDAVRTHRYYPLFALILHAAIRISEAIGLRWSDMDLDRGIITVQGQWQRTLTTYTYQPTKNRRFRSIDLPPAMLDLLRTHRTTQLEERLAAPPDQPWPHPELVFTNRAGGPLNRSMLYSMLKRRLSAANLPRYSIHDLRHIAASVMLHRGASLFEVATVLGHTNTTLVARTYGHLFPEGRARVARLMTGAMTLTESPDTVPTDRIAEDAP
jgi:integrase